MGCRKGVTEGFKRSKYCSKLVYNLAVPQVNEITPTDCESFACPSVQKCVYRTKFLFFKQRDSLTYTS